MRTNENVTSQRRASHDECTAYQSESVFGRPRKKAPAPPKPPNPPNPRKTINKLPHLDSAPRTIEHSIVVGDGGQ